MVKIIDAVCKNQPTLLESADDLTEIIEAENLVDDHPQIVAEICDRLVTACSELINSHRSTGFISESLTTIAIKLHRQPLYRKVGLRLFEQLLALNLREAKAALEVLDRKPSRSGYYATPRRRLRRRVH
jgi:hypothetical protein